MTDSHNSLSLKLVHNSRSIWVPIDSSARVSDLLAKWGQRTEQDSRKFTLLLADGELFESDTLRELSIQQRETIHVVPRQASTPQLHQLHFATKAELPKPTPPQSLQRDPLPSHLPHEIPSHRPVTIIPSGYPPSSSSPLKFHQFFYLNEPKTLRPLQPLDNLSPKKSVLLEQAKALLQSHDEFHHMKPAAVMPAGANENDWLQIYTVAFYNNANIIYSKFVHKCTLENCPHTSAGVQNYLWLDAAKKTPVDIPALEYFSNLFEWIVADNFNDETKFPPLSKDSPYPESFRFCVADISRRIFRAYAHLYHHHYSEFADNGIMPIENFEKSFELFYRFVKEYNLVSETDLKPMEGLINIINM